VRRQHLAVRRGDALYLRWDGELRSVTLFDPISAVDASHKPIRAA
jgi:3-methylcrotonyl-CoA carboxylase alpha subunit